MNVCCQSFSLTCLLVLTFAFSRSSPFIIFLFKFVGNCKEPFLDHVKTSQTLTHANINFNLIFSHEIRMRIGFVLLIWLTNILKGKIFHFCFFIHTQASVFLQPGLTQTLESLSAVCRTRCYKWDDHYNDKNGNVIKSPARKRFKVLTIYTNHPGGNFLHKQKAIKFDVVGEWPATKYTQINGTD